VVQLAISSHKYVASRQKVVISHLNIVISQHKIVIPYHDRQDLELILPSEVIRQVAVIIEGEPHKGERHKVHDEGNQPEDSVSNRCGEARHVVSHLGVMLLISGRGFHVLNIILLQVIDAFAWWQSLHKAFTITCRQGTANRGDLQCPYSNCRWT